MYEKQALPVEMSRVSIEIQSPHQYIENSFNKCHQGIVQVYLGFLRTCVGGKWGKGLFRSSPTLYFNDLLISSDKTYHYEKADKKLKDRALF